MRLGGSRHSEWNSFREVITEITEPVVERVGTITGQLSSSINGVSENLTGFRREHRKTGENLQGLREEHRETGRTLDRLEKAQSAEADQTGEWFEALGRAQHDHKQWDERAQYELHTHVEQCYADLRGRVDYIQRKLADVGAGDPERLTQVIGTGLGQLADEVRHELQSVVERVEALEARTLALARLTRAVMVIALVIAVVAVVVAMPR
jgi:hypothetical protein